MGVCCIGEEEKRSQKENLANHSESRLDELDSPIRGEHDSALVHPFVLFLHDEEDETERSSDGGTDDQGGDLR